MTFILLSRKSNGERHHGPTTVLPESLQTSPFTFPGASGKMRSFCALGLSGACVESDLPARQPSFQEENNALTTWSHRNTIDSIGIWATSNPGARNEGSCCCRELSPKPLLQTRTASVLPPALQGPQASAGPYFSPFMASVLVPAKGQLPLSVLQSIPGENSVFLSVEKK